MDAVRRIFDGYDTGVRFADHHVGRVMDTLRVQGIEEETAVIVSSDHGETLGELGIYCDHQTADQHVCRVPMVVRWPGVAPGVDRALRYQIDVAATVLELHGLEVPARWDGTSFAPAFGGPAAPGRDSLVLTHGAWTAQRAVRFEEWICIWTYHDSFHGFPPVMLFDLAGDPHEQHDVTADNPAVVEHARGVLESWLVRVLGDPPAADPLETVLAEGGPWHARFRPAWYTAYLRDTGRAHWAP
jgi:arylsulfatase A-like enzyme